MNYYHEFKNDEFVHKFIFPNQIEGQFVEIGACGGIVNSQCYFFEKELKWKGVAVDAGIQFYSELKSSRINSCFNAIGGKNEKTTFYNASDNWGMRGVESVLNKVWTDGSMTSDSQATRYEVEMITLIELLNRNNFLNTIHYCGIDAEGCEYDILEHYFENNSKYIILFFALEAGSPGDPRGDSINSLMLKNDYVEVKNPFLNDDIRSQDGKIIDFERYYVHKIHMANIQNNF